MAETGRSRILPRSLNLFGIKQMKHHNLHWIGQDLPGLTFQSEVLPAPCLRRETVTPAAARRAVVRYAAPGYCDLQLDGQAVSDAVLSPTVSIFDRRVRFLEHDITHLLRPGERQTWSAVLGNGWYNCHTSEVWHFDKASWRDWPKLWFELEIDGEVMLTSDRSWKISTGGLLFDSLRNGEHFDARREPHNWRLCGFDDSGWDRPVYVAPPGGILAPQNAPYCRIRQRLTPRQVRRDGNCITVDFGENITGWCEISVLAPEGAEFIIRYVERLDDSGSPESGHAERLAQYTLSGEFQTDHYIAAGNPDGERWHPRFTYHGFRYAVIEISDPSAELRGIEAHFIASDLTQTGDYRTDHPDFEKLRQCALRSYLGNFTGIPTDCPQREKNGWTGDALLAAESGLYFFDAAQGYIEWLETLCDSQRPNGQLAAIAPTGGWGFNGCSGPAWDSVLILLPWAIYRHTGDLDVLRRFYPAMARYLEYCTLREEDDHLLDFGLGDWCAPNRINGYVDRCFTSSAYYIFDLQTAAEIASLLNLAGDSRLWREKAEQVLRSFRARFHPAPFQWGNNTMTELGMVLEMGLAEPAEEKGTAAALAQLAARLEYRAQFGILGAKYAPRALLHHGYADAAWQIYTQGEYPGWVNWLKMGATTLLENWEGSQSWNHIMFGDFAAAAIEYFGGIRLTPEFAAGGPLSIAPCFPQGLNEFEAFCETGRGRVESRWIRKERHLALEVRLPRNCKAEIRLTGQKPILQLCTIDCYTVTL